MLEQYYDDRSVVQVESLGKISHANDLHHASSRADDALAHCMHGGRKFGVKTSEIDMLLGFLSPTIITSDSIYVARYPVNKSRRREVAVLQTPLIAEICSLLTNANRSNRIFQTTQV